MKITAQLFNDECLTALAKIESNSIDLVICDLPYGITQNEWDQMIDLKKLFSEYKRICKDTAPILLFGAMPFSADLVQAGRDIFKYDLVWKKNKSSGHLNAKKRPMRQHESLFVFCKGTPVYFPIKSTGHKPMNYAVNGSKSAERNYDSTNYGNVKPTKNNAGSTERYPTSILDFKVINNDDPKRFHPTQKPIEMLEYLIETYSRAGDTVLDNTMGSGSCGVAAINKQRNFVGIELSKEYFDQASAWIEETKKASSSK